jgi:hypothetical protein
MVQAGAVVGITDIHSRSFPNRLESLENLDLVCVIALWLYLLA